MAIWRLPIHTPWGSASERKTVGKAAEGEREEVQVWGARAGALCVLPGARDYSRGRATQARVHSIHRNGARSALWGPGGHVGQGQRDPAELPRARGSCGATVSRRGTEDPSSPHGRSRGGLCIWGLATPRVHTGSHVCTPPLACPHAHSIAWPPRDWAPSVLLVVPLRWGLGEAHRPQDARLGPWVGVTGTAPRAHPATEGGQTGHRGSQSGATGGHSGQRTAGPAMGRKRREPRPPRALPCLCRGRALPRPDLPPSGHLHSEVLQLPHGSLVRPGWVCPTPDGHLTPSWAWPGRAK